MTKLTTVALILVILLSALAFGLGLDKPAHAEPVRSVSPDLVIFQGEEETRSILVNCSGRTFVMEV